MLNHIFVSFKGGMLSVFDLFEGDHLESEGDEVFTVGNLGSSLGFNSEVSGLSSLMAPEVDDFLVLGHRSSGVSLSMLLHRERLVGSVYRDLELGEG